MYPWGVLHKRKSYHTILIVWIMKIEVIDTYFANWLPTKEEEVEKVKGIEFNSTRIYWLSGMISVMLIICGISLLSVRSHPA